MDAGVATELGDMALMFLSCCVISIMLNLRMGRDDDKAERGVVANGSLTSELANILAISLLAAEEI
jgi:hypothetical protein